MTALNVGFLVLIGQTWHHAIVAGIVQAQIGEFSFLLSVVGADVGVISDGDGRLVVAVTVHRSSAVQPLAALGDEQAHRPARHRHWMHVQTHDRRPP